MNPVLDEPAWKRIRRGALAFVLGLVIALGVVWASRLGLDDRSSSDDRTALNLSVACVIRHGDTAVPYFGGPAAPTGWRCAWMADDNWESQPITPAQACRLLYGDDSDAEPADAESPFAWYCRR